MFDGMLSDLAALRGQYAEAGKKAINAAIKEFLTAHPEVESIAWTQYTPYFADGAACEFSVNDTEVKLVDGDPEAGDAEDGYQSTWDLKYTAGKAGRPVPEALIADLTSLGKLFGEAEGPMQEVFGDHVRVTIGRDGEAQVEEYDHDCPLQPHPEETCNDEPHHPRDGRRLRHRPLCHRRAPPAQGQDRRAPVATWPLALPPVHRQVDQGGRPPRRRSPEDVPRDLGATMPDTPTLTITAAPSPDGPRLRIEAELFGFAGYGYCPNCPDLHDLAAAVDCAVTSLGNEVESRDEILDPGDPGEEDLLESLSPLWDDLAATASWLALLKADRKAAEVALVGAIFDSFDWGDLRDHYVDLRLNPDAFVRINDLPDRVLAEEVFATKGWAWPAGLALAGNVCAALPSSVDATTPTE